MVDRPIEVGFEITVCAEGFADMASSAMLRVKLDWFEIVNIIYEERSGHKLEIKVSGTRENIVAYPN